MSLETLVKRYKAVDQAVLKQYTRLGQHIPEDKLYKMTTGLNLTGLATSVGLLTAYAVPITDVLSLLPLYTVSCYFSTADTWLNILAFKRKLPSQQSIDTAISIDPIVQRNLKDTQRARLPYLGMGLGFLGMLCYDGIQDVMYNHFISALDYVKDALGMVSYLSLASSMYLKDQDPKLLEKQPSKVKAFVKGLYEKAKARVTPSPLPVPVTGYSLLEERLD